MIGVVAPCRLGFPPAPATLDFLVRRYNPALPRYSVATYL